MLTLGRGEKAVFIYLLFVKKIFLDPSALCKESSQTRSQIAILEEKANKFTKYSKFQAQVSTNKAKNDVKYVWHFQLKAFHWV